jgi:hypothetical protein
MIHSSHRSARVSPICKWAGGWALIAVTSGLPACFTAPPADSSPPAGSSTDAGSTQGAGDAGNVTGPVVTIARDGGTPISTYAFGQNYWDWADWANDGITGLTGTEPLVTALHLGVLRAGGDNNDENSPPFDESQIDKFVTYCQTVGAEPILQVPIIAAADGGPASAQTAADMVTYANVTKGYGIKYWEIGNEPDIYPSNPGAAAGVPVTAAAYCSVFQTYAAAMRAAAAAGPDGGTAIQLVGPDLSNKYVSGNDWLTPFLDGCKDDVDIVSIHRYPFSGSQVTIAGSLADDAKFRSTLASVATIVQGHARPGTPLAVTEANVSYDYDPTKYTATSILASPSSYYDAIWVADAMGVALENHLWTMAFWNIGETDMATSVLGFMFSAVPVPAYYGEELIAGNFRGDTVVPGGVPAGFSVYASYDATGATTAVAVINKNAKASPLTIAIDGATRGSYSFPATSITLLSIPDDTTAATHIQQYTPDLADAGMPPAMIQ